MLKNFAGILLLVLTLFITGCWDRREIENRGYVLGVGIDHVESTEPKGQYDLDKAAQAAGRRKYKITFELPKFRKQEASKELSSGQSHLIWSAEGESLFAATRAVSAKVYFAPFFEDIQIIVFSEQVGKEGIRDILDFFQRDAEMRRRVKLLVTPGRAEEVLSAKLQVEEVNSMFIAKTMNSVSKYPHFSSETELGQVASFLRNHQSFTLPLVVVENKEVRLTKAAVFNNQGKMIGKLNELEVMGGKILRKNLQKGIVTVPNPANPSKLAVFEILEHSIKVDSLLVDNQINFVVKAVFIGTIAENMEPKQSAIDSSFLKKLEQELVDYISAIIRSGYRKQQLLHADVSELNSLVYRQHPHYWKQIKDRWDEEIFPTVPLEVDIKVNIARPVLMD